MAIYTVLAPKVRDGDGAPDPLDYLFVKEGLSWGALFFAVPWLVYRRMALVLVAYVAVMIGLGVIAARVGGSFPGLVILAVHFLFALEANELRRWTRLRNGYRLVGVVEGRNREEGELRFFSGLDGAATRMPTPPVPPTPPAPPRKPLGLGPLAPSAEAGDVVGLFPTPGRAS